MSSLNDARMPSLRDKLRAEEAKLEAERLEKLEEESVKKEMVVKKKKSKSL